MGIQRNEISFFTWDFKVRPKIFLGFLKFVPDDSISHYCCLQYKMISLSLNQLKLVAESRGIKDYENKLIKILRETRPKISLFKKRIKEVGEKFNESRDHFSTSKIK